MNVAKKLETSWLQPAGMLYKQEKLLASRLEGLFPAPRRLCLHGFLLSPTPPLRASLSRPTGSPERGVPDAAAALLGLSVPCLSAAPGLSTSSAAGRRMFTWTVALCLDECHRMLKK